MLRVEHSQPMFPVSQTLQAYVPVALRGGGLFKVTYLGDSRLGP